MPEIQPDLELLREDDGSAAEAEASKERRDFSDRLQEERVLQARDDRRQRQRYATRVFLLVTIWLSVIVLLVVLQGSLAPHDWFSLSDSVLIAIATTTTASVTALLVVVLRYLFRSPVYTRSKRNGT